jgi:hypothetical protein
LLSIEKASIELARRKGSVPTVDVLHEGLIVFIKSVEKEGGELLIAERLPNRRKDVRHLLDLIVIGGHRGVQLLDFTKFSADRHRPSHRLRGEAGV